MGTMRIFLLGIGMGLALAACGGPEGGDPTEAEAVETLASPIRAMACGGIMAWRCPDGYVCADDPRDACDPDAGDLDCAYTCQRPRR